MDRLSPPPNGDPRLREEERILRAGYFAMLTERYPFHEDIGHCENQESAYFYALEQEYMNIPEDLTFDALRNDIPEKHRARIEGIWQKVLEMQRGWQRATMALKQKWENAPETKDELAAETIKKTKLKIRQDVEKALIALLTAPPTPAESVLSELETWQTEEKALRWAFYHADKNYFVILRLYYEMLLEKPEDQGNQERVLLIDHPKRREIVFRNRYLRLIDAVHQSISIAKAATHQQSTKRLRKRSPIPYVQHPLNVTGASLLDVIPHTIEQDHLAYNPVLGGSAAAMHDLGEDTELSVKDIEEFLISRADKYDSAIDPVIESGFGLERNQIKRKMLDLVSEHVRGRLHRVLRTLSKNTVLSDQEKKKAIAQNIAGPEQTLKILGLTKMVYRHWTIDENALPPPSKTFVEFPDSWDEKLDVFLIRLNALTTKAQTQQALITKIEDRANNLDDLREIEPLLQQKTLRATTTRLIAWAMLDHDGSAYPLYNALPRLIDITLREYERFQEKFPHLIEEQDRQYLVKLRQWKLEVKRYEVPQRVRDILEEYERRKAA